MFTITILRTSLLRTSHRLISNNCSRSCLKPDPKLTQAFRRSFRTRNTWDKPRFDKTVIELKEKSQQFKNKSQGFIQRHPYLFFGAVTVSTARIVTLARRSPLEDPTFRLTGAIISKPITLGTFSEELNNCCCQAADSQRSAGNTFLPWKKRFKLESTAIFYRNFLARTLWLDDHLRLNKEKLQDKLEDGQRKNLDVLLEEVSDYLSTSNSILKKSKVFGHLAKIQTALQFRFDSSKQPELSKKEKSQLFDKFKTLREQTALHLVPSSTLTLLDLPVSEISSMKSQGLSDRMSNLDLICPLHIGMDHQQLNTLIKELPKAGQQQLLPLMKKREEVVKCNETWNKLVDIRLQEREKLTQSLEFAAVMAKKDCAKLLAHPQFARSVLMYGEHYVDDLYRNHYIMKVLSLEAYFRSPHIAILLEEQHLNKQMNAAKEQLREDQEDPNILMIRSSLKDKDAWIPCNEIPFRNTYIPDDFQRLLRNADFQSLENMDSSSQVEENKIYYLPEKGLCEHNPTDVPEKIEDFVTYQILGDSQNDYFTPVVSFRTEDATVKGTHAFTELFMGGQRIVPGKFSRFNYSYDKVNTYWKVFRNVLPHLLGKHPCSILSPDQNIGYHDRSLATLDHPVQINQEQKRNIYRIMHDHHLCLNGKEFRFLTDNCTGLPEEMLKAAGVDLPCQAPLHTLLDVSHPRLGKSVRWFSEHPSVANPILVSLGWFLGAKNEHKLTVEMLNRVMSPYVLRVWIALKNCNDQIDILSEGSTRGQRGVRLAEHNTVAVVS